MIIKGFKKSIHLKIEDEKTVEDILYSDDLFMSDLYFNTFGSEYLYLEDACSQIVFDCSCSGLNTFYGGSLSDRNFFQRLLAGKTVICRLVGTTQEYEEE